MSTPAAGDGSVGIHFAIPGGEHLSTLLYTLTNGAHSYSASVTVGTASVVSFVIPAVVAGTGYGLSITGVSDDGLVSCSGSFGTGVSDAGIDRGAPFAVLARATTSVNVQLVCVDLPNQSQGGVLVSASANCCPVWDTLLSNPSNAATIAPYNTTQLVGNASGPCDGDAGAGVNLQCTWSVNEGTGTVSPTISDGHGNFDATFTCPPTYEIDIVEMTCTDGPLPDGGACPANLTTGATQIVCAAVPCQIPTVIGIGIVANPNTATGSCPAPSVNTGTLKDALGDFCCSAGPCQGIGVEASPNTATGSCPSGLVNVGTRDTLGNYCCQAANLAPCTTGTTGCVACNGNNSGLCTPTEAALVAHDIAKGIATAPGPDPANSCYACLFDSGCIDDAVFADTGHECEDPLITGTAAECESVISCIFGSSCASSQVATCYCGTATNGNGGTCLGNPAPGPINGACSSVIAAGLGFPVTDGTDNMTNLDDTTRAAGKADQIFTCALVNACTACLQ